MRRSHSVRWAAVLAALSLTPALAAQTAPAPGGFSDTLSLTDAEKAELMDTTARTASTRRGQGVALIWKPARGPAWPPAHPIGKSTARSAR